jgi:hypothetical protein
LIADITTRAADLFGRATAAAENSRGTKPLTCEQAIALADVILTVSNILLKSGAQAPATHFAPAHLSGMVRASLRPRAEARPNSPVLAASGCSAVQLRE